MKFLIGLFGGWGKMSNAVFHPIEDEKRWILGHWNEPNIMKKIKERSSKC